MATTPGHVFLTGASGYIACHILATLLERGFRVTASVRSSSKADQILQFHPEWKVLLLKFVVIPNIAEAGAYDSALKSHDFNYIIHTASPVSFASNVDIEKGLVAPALNGTLGLLTSAHMNQGASLKRFIFLGSMVAVLNSFQDQAVAGKDYTEDDWNIVTVHDSLRANDPILGYNAGKILAEKAAWNFMATEKPSFDLVVLMPDVVIGPMLQPVACPKDVNETISFAVYKFLNGTYTDIESIRFPFYHFVDVRDVALAHVESLTNPAASGRRLLLIAGEVSPQLVANIIRDNFPAFKDQVKQGNPMNVFPHGICPTGWDTRRSTEILSFGRDPWAFIDLEKCVSDTVRSLLKYEKDVWNS